MESVYINTKKESYNQGTYSEWNYLPPNLPLPKSPQLPALYISFGKILYINQMSQNLQDLKLKLEWWGMKNAEIVGHQNQDKAECYNTVVKYLICCNLDRLRDYFLDMKVLVVEISNKVKVIGKAYINFLTFQGWRGERYDSTADIRHLNKKIGELNFSLKIENICHPFLGTLPQKQNVKETTNVSQNRSPYISIRHLGEDQIKQSQNESEYPHKEEIRSYFHLSPKNQSKKITMKEISLGQTQKKLTLPLKMPTKHEIGHSNQSKNPPLGQYRPFEKTQSLAKYDAELIRLVQDYNLLFNKTKQKNQYQQIVQIQLIESSLQGKEEIKKVEIAMPLLDNNINYYTFVQRGLMKVDLGSNNEEKVLMNFLKEADIAVTCNGKYEGRIKLSRILANSGEGVSCPLYEKTTKKQINKKQKGNCVLKATPPQSQSADSNNKQKNQQQLKNKEQKKMVKEEYILINLKNFHTLENEKYQRKINYFVKIYSGEERSAQTESKTFWNSTDGNFNESITYKLHGKTLFFQICDRQKTSFILGKGQINLEGPLGINRQIPIVAFVNRKECVIGYLSIDYVKNGLQSVTKMQDLLRFSDSRPEYTQNNKLVLKPQAQVRQNLEEERKEHSAIIQRQSERQNSVGQEDIKRQVDIYQGEDKEHAIQDILYDKKIERNLSMLQIQNKVFTFMYSKKEIIAQMKYNSYLKISQFTSFMDEMLSSKLIDHKQLSILISNYLFSSPRSEFANKINSTQFVQNFQAFTSYYEQLIETKDKIIQWLLGKLEDQGITINDLEYELRNKKNIWSHLQLLIGRHQMGKYEGIQKIRQFYLLKQGSIFQQNCINSSSFLDSLRKFQVYESFLGEQIPSARISALIFSHIRQILFGTNHYEYQPSYNQVIDLLEEQQIILSTWELMNLRSYIQANPRFDARKERNMLIDYQRQIQDLRQDKEGMRKEKKQERMGQRIPERRVNHFKERQEQKILEKPMISKSPTFGYLHNPQLMKGESLVNQNQMVDSLGVKLTNIAISPINHRVDTPENQTNNNNIKVAFSNLANPHFQYLFVNGIQINLQKIAIELEEQSQNDPQNNLKSSHEKLKWAERSPEFQVPSNYHSSQPDITEYKSKSTTPANKRAYFSIENIQKMFAYQLQILFDGEDEQAIFLECLHGEWTAIVSEQGDYLGGVLVY